MSRYCFSQEYLDSFLSVTISSFHRFVLYEKDITEGEEFQPKAKKRKHDSSANTESPISTQFTKTTHCEKRTQILFDLITSLLDFCAIILCECSDYLSPSVLHEVYTKVFFLSINMFSNKLRLGKEILCKYPNFALFLSSSPFKCALLQLLESMVLRPNLKCSPPLSMIADIFTNAKNDKDPNVLTIASRGCKVLDSLFKPDNSPPFGTVLMQYEPETKTSENSSQTESCADFQNAYTQTTNEITANIATNSEGLQGKLKQNRSVGSQTVAKMNHGNPERLEVNVGSKMESKSSNSKVEPCMELSEADFESFSSICEQFFPSVV